MRPLDFLGRIKVKLGLVIVLAVVTAFVVNELGLSADLPGNLRIAIAVVLAVIMVQIMARGMTKPLREMAAAAQTIAKGRYGLRVSATSRDEVGELARAFNAMAADLAEVDRQRRELVANVSHELRTPITGLQAVLENVVDGVSPPDRETLGTALAQTQRLGRLVAQLLDLSRLDSGARTIDAEAFDLGSLCGQAAREAGLATDAVTVRSDVTPGLHVKADPALLAQVLANLLDNAVRHSPPGATVRLEGRAAGSDVQLIVHDEGPGIPAPERARVFERFSRLDAARAADVGGAGLGLAIAKEIVELHQGTIRVVDQPRGCRMLVQLPGRTHMSGTSADPEPDVPEQKPTPAAVTGATTKSSPTVGHTESAQNEPVRTEATTATTTSANSPEDTPSEANPSDTLRGVIPSDVLSGAIPSDMLRGSVPSEAVGGAIPSDAAGESTSPSPAFSPWPAQRHAAPAGARDTAPGGPGYGWPPPGAAYYPPPPRATNSVRAGVGAGLGVVFGFIIGLFIAFVFGVWFGAVGGAAILVLLTGGGAVAGAVIATVTSRTTAPAMGTFGPTPWAVPHIPTVRPTEPSLDEGNKRDIPPEEVEPMGNPPDDRTTLAEGDVLASTSVSQHAQADSPPTHAAKLPPPMDALKDGDAETPGAAVPAHGQQIPPRAPDEGGTSDADAPVYGQQVSAEGSTSPADAPAHGQPVPTYMSGEGGTSGADVPRYEVPSHSSGGSDTSPAGVPGHGQQVPQGGPGPAGVSGQQVPAYASGGGGASPGMSMYRHGQAPPYSASGGGAPPAYVPPPLFPRPDLPETPSWVLPAAAGAGVVAAVLLPYAPKGLGLVLTAVAMGVAVLPAARRRVTAWSVGFALLAYALVAVTLIRDAEWVLRPVLVVAVLVASLGLSGSGRGWFSTIRGGVSVGLAVFPTPWFLLTPVKSFMKRRRLLPILVSLGITVVLLAIFGLLFMAADAVFSQFARDLLEAPMWVETLPYRIFLFVVFGVVVAAAVLVALRPVAETEVPLPRVAIGRTLWVIPLAGLNLLFAAFVAVQITVLFGGNDRVLKTAGLTYAEYARSGFFELVTVSFIVLAIVALCWALLDPATHRWLLASLLGLLCAFTLVILASALHRLDLYLDAYGLTRLRATVGAMIWWLAAVFVLVLVAGAARLKRLPTTWLPRTFVLLTGVTFLVFALWNPDTRIAETQLTVRGVDRLDHRYLSSLGVEAVPTLDRFPEPVRSCVLDKIVRDHALDRPDPWNGWNYARNQARATLAAHPVLPSPQCPDTSMRTD